MADRYFKKSKDKFKVGYSDTIFKYDFTRHNIQSLKDRFTECDANGKELKVEKKVEKTVEKKKTKK